MNVEIFSTERQSGLMALSISSLDLKLREVAGYAARVGGSGSFGNGSFAEALAAAYRTSGGTKFENYFQIAAETYQIPENLLKAVAKAESDFNPNAVSSCGAQGIMQLMPSTARALGVSNSFDPAQNIMGGAKYLRQMLDNFDGDVSKALAAYNAGPGAVRKYDGIPPYKETQNYVAKVLGYAGDVTSVPAAAAAAAADVPAEDSSGDSLMSENFVDLLLSTYGADGGKPQGYAQVLVQQMLLQAEKANEDDEDKQERTL